MNKLKHIAIRISTYSVKLSNICKLFNYKKYAHRHVYPVGFVNYDYEDWDRFNSGNDESIDFYDFDLKLSGIGNTYIWMDFGVPLKPHFHIINEDASFDTCIRLDKPEYYMKHGYIPDTLNEIQKKELYDKLMEKNKYNDFSNWVYLNSSWNYDIWTVYITNIVRQCPDYTKLK